MARTSAHKAVYAGLLSMVVVAHPTANPKIMALPSMAELPIPDMQQVLPFSAGVVFGAALCAGIVLGSDALAKRAAEKSRSKAENDLTHAEPSIAADAQHEFSDGRSYVPSHAARGWEQAQDPSQTQVARASHSTNDYEQIAENKARVAAARERKEARRRGVGSVLLERLGAGFGSNMMDGLPVIPRADGTIADVGTSWWHASVDKNAMREGFSDFEMPTVWETAQMEEAELAAVAQRKQVASDEPRIVDDELWQSAMSAMEGLSHEDAPFEFADVVGTADSLDDPDDLESPTTFIPFRTPAGHPEVVDTESYISYILEDEFSKLESQSVKRTAKNYLKVIEGGTTRIIEYRKKQHSTHYVPRHMKPQPQQEQHAKQA